MNDELDEDLVTDPGVTPGSVHTEWGQGPDEVPQGEPKTRREAYLMAKALIGKDRSHDTIDVMSVADWLLGEFPQTRVELDAPAPVVPGTASAYEPVRRQRAGGLAFLYLHPPCHTVEWRDAIETLQPHADCSAPDARWEVMYREKASA